MRRSTAGLLAGLLIATLTPALASAADGREVATALAGDWMLSWRSGAGLGASIQGAPVVRPHAAEFIVHEDWQKVHFRSANGRPTADLDEVGGKPLLMISDSGDRFTYWQTVSVTDVGSLRLDYSYHLVGLEKAELQLLFNLDASWFDGADYLAVSEAGEETTGRFELPEKDRVDPWAGIVRLTLRSARGALAIASDKPFNILCRPTSASIWWTPALVGEAEYTTAVEFGVEPAPELGGGVRLTGLDWSDSIRDGTAELGCSLQAAAGAPESVTVTLEREGDKPTTESASDTVALPAGGEARCALPVSATGWQTFRAIVRDPLGAEIQRIDPLYAEVRPYLRVKPALSLFTHEETAEVLADIADDLPLEGLSLELTGAGSTVRQDATAPRESMRLPMAVLSDGETAVSCRLMRGEEELCAATTTLRKAPPKPNEVKIDNRSLGLIVDGLPTIPVGFYTYKPVDETMDSEIVNGFNLISPYHWGPHNAADLDSIQAYLDRCAQIGMKVNYHLIWAARAGLTEENEARVREEVLRFRDHPALLAWYTADEPPNSLIEPLARMYAIIKELDPYHPVCQVFNRGADHARPFMDSLDIAMADPYPIPNTPVTDVSDVCDAILEVCDGTEPLWIVPQAFGGGEWWSREPTPAEERVMSYLALIHGATGLQYFVRRPEVRFPKSPQAWSECSAVAFEAAEMTPALLSPEPRPEVTSSVPSVHAAAWQERGIITILAANAENAPTSVRIELPGVAYSGPAEVLFENRTVTVANGAIEEMVDAFGTRAYAIPAGPLPEEDLAIDPADLTVNPSFEYLPAAGVPSEFYADHDPGTTSIVDSRVARHGRHSLRLIAPTDEQTPALRRYPVRAAAGDTLRASLWAKATTDGVKLRFWVDGVGEQVVDLTTEWTEYAFEGVTEEGGRIHSGFGLRSAGTAWVDLVQIVKVAKAEE